MCHLCYEEKRLAVNRRNRLSLRQTVQQSGTSLRIGGAKHPRNYMYFNEVISMSRYRPRDLAVPNFRWGEKNKTRLSVLKRRSDIRANINNNDNDNSSSSRGSSRSNARQPEQRHDKYDVFRVRRRSFFFSERIMWGDRVQLIAFEMYYGTSV